jgi:hypothetical protein
MCAVCAHNNPLINRLHDVVPQSRFNVDGMAAAASLRSHEVEVGGLNPRRHYCLLILTWRVHAVSEGATGPLRRLYGFSAFARNGFSCSGIYRPGSMPCFRLQCCDGRFPFEYLVRVIGCSITKLSTAEPGNHPTRAKIIAHKTFPTAGQWVALADPLAAHIPRPSSATWNGSARAAGSGP